MLSIRAAPFMWLVPLCLLSACGDRGAAAPTIAVPRAASEQAARTEQGDPRRTAAADRYAQSLDVPSPDAELALLSEIAAGPTGQPPGPNTQFPVEGPRGFALFPLDEGQAYYEYNHNEHWGITALYLYDAWMQPRPFDAPPVLNVRCDGESLTLQPSRESFEGRVDGGWHFEDDALLGVPESGRFRFLVEGRYYAPPFAHVHLGHDHVHATEHETGPHVHGPGPHGGTVVTLGAHRAHVEVVHKPNWGILSLYVYDAAMKPGTLDREPVLNIVSDEESLQLEPGRENWDGEVDTGWHFEDDALLGETGPARFRLTLDGKTFIPPFVYHAHGEEPGHTHDAVTD